MSEHKFPKPLTFLPEKQAGPTVADHLRALLADIESGKVDPKVFVMLWTGDLPAGKWSINFSVVSPSPIQTLGLIELAKESIIEIARKNG